MAALTYPGPVNDKATQIMDKMLLSQYDKSPILKEYILAFVEEMNELFYEINEVYYRRFIDIANDAQLDVIGEILQQPRSVVLPDVYFGFQGAAGVIAGMADQATPANGGIFRSGEISSLAELLDNTTYRRLLLCRAECMNSNNNSYEGVYSKIITLLGKVPATLSLVDTGPRTVELTLDSAEVTTKEVSLIAYASSFIIPMGTIASIIVL